MPTKFFIIEMFQKYLKCPALVKRGTKVPFRHEWVKKKPAEVPENKNPQLNFNRLPINEFIKGNASSWHSPWWASGTNGLKEVQEYHFGMNGLKKSAPCSHPGHRVEKLISLQVRELLVAPSSVGALEARPD